MISTNVTRTKSPKRNYLGEERKYMRAVIYSEEKEASPMRYHQRYDVDRTHKYRFRCLKVH